VLKRNGIEPSPERGKRTQWSTFLKAHWKALFAADFLTVEVWTARGLVTHYLLLVMGLAERVVRMVGITTRPDEAWMLQIGRSLTDCESGALRSKHYLIISGQQGLPGEIGLDARHFRAESFLGVLLGYGSYTQANPNAEIALVDRTSAVGEDGDTGRAGRGHELLL